MDLATNCWHLVWKMVGVGIFYIDILHGRSQGLDLFRSSLSTVDSSSQGLRYLCASLVSFTTYPDLIELSSDLTDREVVFAL